MPLRYCKTWKSYQEIITPQRYCKTWESCQEIITPVRYCKTWKRYEIIEITNSCASFLYTATSRNRNQLLYYNFKKFFHNDMHLLDYLHKLQQFQTEGC